MTDQKAFEQLHPLIRKQIYRMKWGQLRPIQRDAIFAVTETLNHLIISAATASGKTEAAFLPILSSFVENPTGGVKSLYVGPLKALINDQFQRLEEICHYTEIPVYKWHGDASPSRKQKVRSEPSGVLLITPESIESLFLNYSLELKHMFSDLRFIVIDEMHSFMGTERGAHLKSLLSRLAPISKQHLRLIGLSATLGDDDLARQWLYPDDPEIVTLIKGEKGERTIRCKIKGYIRKTLKLTPESHASEEKAIKTPEDAKLAYRHLVKKYHPDLAQSDAEKEEFTVWMKEINSAYHDGRFRDLSRLLAELDPASVQKIDILNEHMQKFEDGSEDDFTIAQDILKCFYRKTALIFGNSRSSIEQYADIVCRILEQEKLQNSFRVHHGSLSKNDCEDTESALKNSPGIAAFCSSTLEMGIDVGNVQAVGQIGPTWSVNSLCQRLGRSGRRDGEASTLWMFISEDELNQKQDIVAGLYPDLLQSIAMMELILEEWCEPPEIHRLHLSTFIQQVISLIAETGGRRVDIVYRKLVINGAFRNIDRDTYVNVLRSMKDHDLIEQTPEGELILGLKGESVVRSLDFYSAFATPINFRVLNNGRLIGTIDGLPGADSESDKFLILAGKRWKLISIDYERLEIIVEPSKAGKVPNFRGNANLNIHSKVREKMFEVLQRQDLPVYLDVHAQEMLTSARLRAKEVGLLDNSFIQNGNQVIWFTWTSSKIHRTLWSLARLNDSLEVEGIDAPYDDLTLVFNNQLEQVLEVYSKLLQKPPQVEEIARAFKTQGKEKYDLYLSNELQAILYAHNALDLPGSLKVIKYLRTPEGLLDSYY